MPTRLSFFTDLHLRGQGPSSRKDDYPQSILNKLQYCLKYASERSDAVLFGGDFCDSHRLNSDHIKEKTIEIFDEYSKTPFYYTWGQHDLFGKDYSTRNTSTKAFILRQASRVIGGIEELPIDSFHSFDTNGETIGISACPSGVDPITWSKKFTPSNDKYTLRIAVVHHLLCPDKSEWLIPINDFNGKPFDVVLCGDLHQGFVPTISESDETLFLNPGSLARTQKTSENLTREIRGVDILLENGQLDYEFWPVECAQDGKEVFRSEAPIIEEKVSVLQEKHNSEEMNFEDVVKALDTIGFSRVDIWDMIESKARENKLPEEITNYILSKRPDA